MEKGAVFKVKYPFVRATYTEFDEDGGCEVETWNPGIRNEPLPPYGEDVEIVCDGFGEQILTVIDVHKPGKYPTRVFYTASYITPEGKAFGKGKLRITTVDALKRRAAGFYVSGYGTPKLASVQP